MTTMTMQYGTSFPRRTQAANPPLRLTARGRRVVTAVVLLVAMMVASFAISTLRAAAGPASFSPTLVSSHSVVVKPGDTLWTIATRELHGLDPMEAVQRIREANAMSSTAVLAAGSTLIIPSH